MLLRLRHAVPFLQKINGWTTSSSPALPLTLTRHFGRTATAVASAAPEDAPESSDASTTGSEPKRTRRSPRITKSKAASAPAPAAEAEAAAADSSGDASTSAPKRRTRRKAVSTSGSEEPAGQQDTPAAAASSAEAGSVEAPPPAPRRTRKKKAEAGAEVVTAPAVEAAEAGAPAEESSGSGKGTRKRASSTGKAASKKAAAAAAAAEEPVAEPPTESSLLQSLPFEDCLVLPRKAEKLLEALGIRLPRGAAAAQLTPPPALPAPGTAGGLRNVLELARYLGLGHPKDTALPLLLAQYQSYLGNSPDFLYDKFCLDFDLPCLASDDVKEAATEAAKTARSLISAKGEPVEALYRRALELLRARVGEEAVAAQEGMFPGLTHAQLELFLLDWASASLAGVTNTTGTEYFARRCAALQLTRKTSLERLHHYAVLGAPLADLTLVSARQQVKLARAMEALVEGLKAGVRLDRDRLLEDFRLGRGEPLHDHLPDLQRAVVEAADRATEPGSQAYYAGLYDQLRGRPDVSKAIQEQERRWCREQAERDGSTLTIPQLRVLFHLSRLDRFREQQEQARLRQASGQEPQQ